LALPLAVFEFPNVLGSIGVCVRTETQMKKSRGRGQGGKAKLFPALPRTQNNTIENRRFMLLS